MNRIIINTSNSTKGGALQVGLSFIAEANLYKNAQFHVILGRETIKLIDKEKYANVIFHEVNLHPMDSLTTFLKFKRVMSKIEKKIDPIGVITVFGPCYWKPKCLHIQGFANGYLLYDETYYFKSGIGKKGFVFQLKKRIHKFLLKRESVLLWTETDDSKFRLSKFLKIKESKIVVASNNASGYFSSLPYIKFDRMPLKKTFRLLYISSYYPHKGFEILARIMKKFGEDQVDIELVVTIDHDSFSRHFSAFDNVHNLGQVHPKYCPDIYQNCDAVVIPSLLETFSATYPEAMISSKPIVTTNLPFSRDICGDAALYFSPKDSNEACNQILKLINSKQLRKELINKGKQRLSQFETPPERFEKVLEKLLVYDNENKG